MSNNTAAYASSIIKLTYHIYIYILTNWLVENTGIALFDGQIIYYI